MTRFLLAALGLAALFSYSTACERHSWEETRQLHLDEAKERSQEGGNGDTTPGEKHP